MANKTVGAEGSEDESNENELGLDMTLAEKLHGQGFMIGSDRAVELAREIDVMNKDCFALSDGHTYRVAETMGALRGQVAGIRKSHGLLVRALQDTERKTRYASLQTLVQFFRGNEQPLNPHAIIERHTVLGTAMADEFKHMVIAQQGHVLRLIGYAADTSAIAQRVAMSMDELKAQVVQHDAVAKDIEQAVRKQQSAGRPSHLSEELGYQARRRHVWQEGRLEDNAQYLQQLSARRPRIERQVLESLHAARFALRVYRETQDVVDYFDALAPVQIDRIYQGRAVREILAALTDIRTAANSLDKQAADGYRELRDFKPPKSDAHRDDDKPPMKYL